MLGEYFFKSGLVMNENLHWISYHGSFDYGYFYRLIKLAPLPDYQEDFLNEIKIYFPHNYDMKYLIGKKFGRDDILYDNMQGGLSRIADNLSYCLMHRRIPSCIRQKSHPNAW